MNQEDEKIVVNFFTLFEFENDNFVVKLTEKTHTKRFIDVETFIAVEAEVKGVVSKFYNEISIENYYTLQEWKAKAGMIYFLLGTYKKHYKVNDPVFDNILDAIEQDTLPFVIELIEREKDLDSYGWDVYYEDWGSDDEDGFIDDDLADPVI